MCLQILIHNFIYLILTLSWFFVVAGFTVSQNIYLACRSGIERERIKFIGLYFDLKSKYASEIQKKN